MNEPPTAVEPPSDLVGKLERLRAALRGMGRVVVAFSGGVDSAFVLKIAVDTLGAENVLAVTSVSDSVSTSDREDAAHLASSLAVRHLLIDPGEFNDPRYLANPENRCYFCKSALYAALPPLLRQHGFDAVVNGTNADDLGDYRPGLLAANEHGVRSPCVEAGLTKQDIRQLSRRAGLPTHDKPASPCLSSRVQYGEAITPQKLKMIEQAENLLKREGFRVCRVRHHDTLARIEVPRDDIERLASEPLRSRVADAFRRIGYSYTCIDLNGFRSGSMNDVIAFGRRQQNPTT